MVLDSYGYLWLLLSTEFYSTFFKFMDFFNFSFSLSGSFAGGTWDWEYLGFASPEVKTYSLFFFS